MQATTIRFPGPTPARRLWAVGLALALAAASCGGDGPAPAADGGIDRETFIATYVDLRATTIRRDCFAISDAQREQVLARRSVTEEELLSFVELHGEDADFMRAVWDEVEARLDAERVLASPAEGVAADSAMAQPADPAPMELAYSSAVETLCGLDIPVRAQWLRVLQMELSRIAHSTLFWMNLVLVVYTLYGYLSPLDFFWHPGTSFYRIVTSSTVELATGIYGLYGQLALTVIAAFLILSASSGWERRCRSFSTRSSKSP